MNLKVYLDYFCFNQSQLELLKGKNKIIKLLIFVFFSFLLYFDISSFESLSSQCMNQEELRYVCEFLRYKK